MRLEDVEEIARALDRAGARYIVVGGLAVALHGYSRTTYDLDLVLQLEPRNILAGFAALAELGYRPLVPITAEQFANEALRRSWIDEKGMKVLNFNSDRHRETGVDVFVAEPFDFDDEYKNAYRQDLMPGITLRIARIDTLVAMKRVAGRAKDLADIEELLSIKKALDE